MRWNSCKITHMGRERERERERERGERERGERLLYCFATLEQQLCTCEFMSLQETTLSIQRERSMFIT